MRWGVGKKLSTPSGQGLWGHFSHIHSLRQKPSLIVTVAYPKPQKIYLLKPLLEEVQSGTPGHILRVEK